MAARTQEEQDELVRIWDAQEKELAELGRKIRDIGHVGRYLEEDVLEIERVQYLGGDNTTGAAWLKDPWVTSKYVLTTGTGGPHVEFDTDHVIHVYWAGGVQEATTYHKDALKAINAIGDYLDEIYSR